MTLSLSMVILVDRSLGFTVNIIPGFVLLKSAADVFNYF